MVLSVKQKTTDRIFTAATVFGGCAACIAFLRAGDFAALNNMLSFLWGYWEFFRGVGDYEYDIKGISCQ
ncbi:hypothetical protein VPT02_055 [Vibrio phage VPT02]|uniref:Uncharacterized protein n=1 Tax=Vibrio phage pVp-1 TaxID=1150989 RepID=H6WXH9_9CAUD|nr:hypothetical protein F404_gp088 [Vibrio phage pVp-1]AFB83945.1 hypothetical protein pVp-1_0088 [Vibrio phage pVp-1]QIG60631.1 hypothetical protein VPT02_055 [Vibrio phage VPT02]